MNNAFYKFIYKECSALYDENKFKFLKNKKILITGATGVLGQYFIAFFLKATESKYRPKQIILIHKNKIPNYLLFLKKKKIFQFRKLNLAKQKIKQKNRYNYILHLATYGQPKKFLKNPVETYFLNTSLLGDLATKLTKGGNFLFLSSSEVYFGLSNRPKEDKIGIINPSMDRAPYIFSKLSGETFLNILRNKYKINTKSVRLCLAFGPGNKKNDNRAMYEIINKGLLKKKIILKDSGLDRRSYIYILDAVKMIINIFFFGKENTYNIGGKKIITIKELAEEISEILKIPFQQIRVRRINKSSPKLSIVNTDLYNKEFGKINYYNFKKALNQTILWQKFLNKK
jgi:UDP-glucuronate decarboxylase